MAIDRAGFMVDPTSCAAGRQVTATLGSSEGASATVSRPYATTGCKELPFKPSFSAETPGKASFNGNGAGLTVHLVPPSEGAGSSDPEANLHEVG